MPLMNDLFNVFKLAGFALIFGLLNCTPSFAENQPHIAYDADLFLVPIGPVPSVALESFAAHFRQIINFKVEITAPLQLPDRTVDSSRKQLIAEQVNDVLARVFGPTLHKSSALVIGVTAHDMYIASTNWRFAYAHGNGQYAVVSAAHMGDDKSNNAYWSPAVVLRAQKMLSKRVAIQSLGVGSRLPTPPILSTPILGPADLDQLDAQALDHALADASRFFTPQYAKPAPFEVDTHGTASDEKIQLQILLLVAFFIAVGASVYLALKRHLRKARATWQTFAHERGWHYAEGKKRWYGSPFSIEGKLDETNFILSWYLDGSGRSARDKTHFTADFASPYELNITPISSLSVLLFSHDRTKTGDRVYDCHFHLNPIGRTPRISEALRNKHLAMATKVAISKEQVQLIFNGNANPAEAEILLDLAKDWLRALRDTTHNADTQEQQVSMRVFTCWLSRFAEPVFWLFSITSIGLILIDGSEATNLPWMISWDFLWPPAIFFGALWLGVRWSRKKLQSHFLADTAVVAIALIYVWGLSGPWVLAWNAKVGQQLDVLVVGAVTEKSTSSGKGGTRHYMSLNDIESRREIKLNVDLATYEPLRVGDPVAFKLTKGSWGIYHFTK